MTEVTEFGRIFSRNITQHKDNGIGNWTDDEIARAIREGVSRDGRPLFSRDELRQMGYVACIDAQVVLLPAFQAVKDMLGFCEQFEVAAQRTTAFMKEDRGGKVFVDATRVGGPSAVSPAKRCSHTPMGWLNRPPVAVSNAPRKVTVFDSGTAAEMSVYTGTGVVNANAPQACVSVDNSCTGTGTSNTTKSAGLENVNVTQLVTTQ